MFTIVKVLDYFSYVKTVSRYLEFRDVTVHHYMRLDKVSVSNDSAVDVQRDFTFDYKCLCIII